MSHWDAQLKRCDAEDDSKRRISKFKGFQHTRNETVNIVGFILVFTYLHNRGSVGNAVLLEAFAAHHKTLHIKAAVVKTLLNDVGIVLYQVEVLFYVATAHDDESTADIGHVVNGTRA